MHSSRIWRTLRQILTCKCYYNFYVAELFAKQNFVVHLIDLRGFGYSGGPRGS